MLLIPVRLLMPAQHYFPIQMAVEFPSLLWTSEKTPSKKRLIALALLLFLGREAALMKSDDE